MSRLSNVNRSFLPVIAAILVALLAACATSSSSPRPDVGQLEAAGFKILLAQTPLQQERIQRLPTGKFTELQRTGVHFYLYPDVPNNRVFLGSPKELQAYQRMQPGGGVSAQSQQAQLAAQQAKDMSNYAKQDVAMTAASQRDMSDPYLNFYWPTLDELNW